MDSESGSLSLAAMYLDSNRPRDAVRIAAGVLKRNPDDVDALMIVCRALIMQKQYKYALSAAKRLTAAGPHSPGAWQVAAQVFTGLERYEDARECASTAQRLALASWAAHVTFAEIDTSQQVLTDDGLRAARAAVRLAPDEPDAHLTLGNLLRLARDPDGAEREYRVALRINPSHVAARHNLALITMHRGDVGHAASGFLDVLSQNPHHVLANRNLRVAMQVAVAQLFPALGAVVTLMVIVTGVTLFYSHWPEAVLDVIRALLVVAFITSFVVVARRVLRLRRGSGARFRQFVQLLREIDKYSTAFALLFGLVLAIMLVACFTAFDVSACLYASCWVILIAVAIVSAVHDSEEKRRAEVARLPKAT